MLDETFDTPIEAVIVTADVPLEGAHQLVGRLELQDVAVHAPVSGPAGEPEILRPAEARP